eukprot:756299-Hanusia_phi.AAC.6
MSRARGGETMEQDVGGAKMEKSWNMGQRVQESSDQDGKRGDVWRVKGAGKAKGNKKDSKEVLTER